MSWKSGEAMRIKLGGDRKFTGGVRYYHRHAEGRDSSKAALQWREHQVKGEDGAGPEAPHGWVGPRVPSHRELGEHDLLPAPSLR